MALVIADRVRETSTTTGTGTLTLAGAVPGFQTFSTAIGNTNTCYYTIVNGSEFEIGLGTVAAGTLARTTVLRSSNAGSAVNFSAGSKDVFGTYPADKSVLGSTAKTLGGVGYGDGNSLAFTSAGTSGQVLTSAGAAAPTWAAPGGGFTSMSISTSSGTFTIPTGITTMKVTVVGAGGGGGGYNNGGTGGSSSVASGTQTISTISGAGATGGLGSNTTWATTNNGGIGSGGTLNIKGGAGTGGVSNGGQYITGTGGSSFLGGGGCGTYTGAAADGGVYGGGGGGGQTGQGGGGGGTAIKYLTSLTPGNTLTVTIGTGGVAGTGGPGAGVGGAGVVIFEY